MAIGTVARFDCRRGYGFVIPDDGGEDVFVHQNNIVMDGFRYLRAGERISYEPEAGDKGLKAVQVQLLEPRQEETRDQRDQRDQRDLRDLRDHRDSRGPRGPRDSRDSRDSRDRRDRGPRQHHHDGGNDHGHDAGVDKVRRRLERLVNLLVEKGVLAPGELDTIEQDMEAAGKAIKEQSAPTTEPEEAEINPESAEAPSAEAPRDEYAQSD